MRVVVMLVAATVFAACGRSPTPTSEDVQGTDGGTARIADSSAGCVDEYSSETLRDRAFAFDGTVSAIGGGASSDDLYIDVTFQVNEWFRGDGAEEVSVQLMPSGTTTSDGHVSYDVGTRLLVSGEPRWGGDPLEKPVAWACGFTREHTESAAVEWRRTFSEEH